MLQRSVANLRARRSRRCSKEQKKEQSIPSRSAHTSAVQAGPANHSANACRLANADQELTFHLSQHASKHLPHWFPPDSPLILTNQSVWWTSWFPMPCLMSGLIRHDVTAGRVPSAWKQLKNWTYATARTDHAFIFFFFFLPFLLAKWRSELFRAVVIGVCTQKDNLHARVCADSISCVYSDFNCCGLCEANIIWCSSHICTRQQKDDIGCEDAQACL